MKMDQLTELAVKAQRALNALQRVNLPATPENMRSMLIGQNEIEEIKNGLIRLSAVQEEENQNGRDGSEDDHSADRNPE